MQVIYISQKTDLGTYSTFSTISTIKNVASNVAKKRKKDDSMIIDSDLRLERIDLEKSEQSF